MSTVLYIKDMVCIRCKMVVEAVLDANEISYGAVDLGRVKLHAPLTAAQKEAVSQGLAHYRLSIMESRNKILVEQIKTEIIAILQSEEPLRVKLSVHLSQTLNLNYTYLSNMFSDEEGITLERYFIRQRIERVKELIIYDNLSLAQITEKLNFSNVSHLGLHFKKVTGITPAEFRKRCQSEDFVWRSC